MFGFLAGYFRDTWIDKLVTTLSITGVSMPHYWLGMVLVIIFSVQLGWLPAVGAGPGGWAWDWAHIQFMVLPAVTMSVIPMGIVARTGAGAGRRSAQPGIRHRAARQGPHREARVRARGEERRADRHRRDGPAVRLPARRLDPDRTVFSWPGTGFLLNSAIFQRDLPLLQGTILVLALFFVFLNLVVDVIQAAIDPRIKRA
jgi:peptide/nickel transport system permease protein